MGRLDYVINHLTGFIVSASIDTFCVFPSRIGTVPSGKAFWLIISFVEPGSNKTLG